MRKSAEAAETQRIAARHDGGIVQAFSAQIMMNRKGSSEAAVIAGQRRNFTYN